MALTAARVRKAKATGKAHTLPDFDGLSLAVSASGTKAWHFRYSWLGRQKRLSLGAYPKIGLREARSQRDHYRALVAKGIHPQRERAKTKRLAAKAEADTFEAVYEHWLEFRRRSRLKVGRQTTLVALPRIFGKDALPALRRRPIRDITRVDRERAGMV